jgi:hypothetical protein
VARASFKGIHYFIKKIKSKAILLTRRGGPLGCETSWLPHFLDNRLIDGGEAVSAGQPVPPGRFLVLISVRGWLDPRAIVRIRSTEKSNYLTGNRKRGLRPCSIVPQQTTLQRAPFINEDVYKIGDIAPPFLTSVLDGGEWSSSPPWSLYCGEITPGIQYLNVLQRILNKWITGCVLDPCGSEYCQLAP